MPPWGMFGLTVICSDKENRFIHFQWKLVIWCNVRDRDCLSCHKIEASSTTSCSHMTYLNTRIPISKLLFLAFVENSSLLRAIVLFWISDVCHYCMNEIRFSFYLSLPLFLSLVPHHTEWLMGRCVRGIWLMSSIFLHIVRGRLWQSLYR